MAAKVDVLAEGYADERVASTVVLIREGAVPFPDPIGVPRVGEPPPAR